MTTNIPTLKPAPRQLRFAAEILAYLESKYGLTITRQSLHNYADPNHGKNFEVLRTTTIKGPNGHPIRVATVDDVDRFVQNAYLGYVTPRVTIPSKQIPES